MGMIHSYYNWILSDSKLNPSCLSLFLLHLQPWQGKPQLVSNINACTAVANVVRTTLDPRGMDKLIHDDKGAVTISNDGATIMKLLDIVHLATKILADIAKSQDSEYFNFNEVRPLEAERFKALRIQWAQYYLKVRNQT
ncbi:T-complex protein 1 subunit eta [Glycine max]|nr:T-complex protein 1 subunit eta [Glycine max]